MGTMLKPRINRLAFERQLTEDTLMDTEAHGTAIPVPDAYVRSARQRASPVVRSRRETFAKGDEQSRRTAETNLPAQKAPQQTALLGHEAEPPLTVNGDPAGPVCRRVPRRRSPSYPE